MSPSSSSCLHPSLPWDPSDYTWGWTPQTAHGCTHFSFSPQLQFLEVTYVTCSLELKQPESTPFWVISSMGAQIISVCKHSNRTFIIDLTGHIAYIDSIQLILSQRIIVPIKVGLIHLLCVYLYTVTLSSWIKTYLSVNICSLIANQKSKH